MFIIKDVENKKTAAVSCSADGAMLGGVKKEIW